jgi:hypothetical protein
MNFKKMCLFLNPAILLTTFAIVQSVNLRLTSNAKLIKRYLSCVAFHSKGSSPIVFRANSDVIYLTMNYIFTNNRDVDY